jgi:DNA-binding transcriptional MerR regulator
MDPDKLAKVLALAESDHQGEAQSALRAARIMLARAGLSFRDLAVAARQPGPRLEPPARPHPPVVVTESLDTGALRSQLRDLEQRLEDMEQALAREREDLARQRQETKRWHQLARETAEQLWDVGKVLETQNTSQPKPTVTDRRQELMTLLQDPASAALSDREIARRLGIAPHAVGYWRRRLARLAHSRQRCRVQTRGRGPLGRITDGIRRD